MPNPALQDVHVNRPLTNISIAYLQRNLQFASRVVFPIVPVPNKSDSYYTYDRTDWFRTEAKVRAPGTESAGSGYRISTATYTATVQAVHKDIDDQIRANADAPLNLDQEATEWVTFQLLLRMEKDWIANYFTTSIWDRDITGGTTYTQWSDASSTPIEDVTTESLSITEKTGFKPNTLVLGPRVYAGLKNHPDVLDRIKYGAAPGSPALATTQALAALFDVERVVTPYITENTAAENQTGAYSFVFGKHALLCYVPPSPGLLTPSAGYTFTWSGYPGAGRDGLRISRFRMENLKSDRVEGEMAYSQKVVASPLGAFFSGMVA